MSPALIAVLSISAVLAVALVVWRGPVLAFAQRTAVFTQQVRGEVRKVTWPTWDDLRRSTIIITIFVIIIGIIIGLMDTLFSLVLIRWLGQVFA